MNREQLCELFSFRFGIPSCASEGMLDFLCERILGFEGDMEKIAKELDDFYLSPEEVSVYIFS